MYKHTFLFLFIVAVFAACNNKEQEGQGEKYDGPTAIAFKVNTLYTEFGNTKIKLKAPEQAAYEGGDREFPKGMHMFFYKKEHTGKHYATLVADFAHYYDNTKYWKLVGNVVYEDIEQRKILRAKVLFWQPSTRKLWSDDFVHITAPGKELMGDGLDAIDDFSWYKVKNPRGKREKI